MALLSLKKRESDEDKRAYLRRYITPATAATTGFKRSSSVYDVEGAKRRKTIKTHGPVDFEKNIIVPFEELDSYHALAQQIDAGLCPLFVGHFQSGKSSTLLYLHGTRKHHFYVHGSNLQDSSSNGFLNDLCKALSLSTCNNQQELSQKVLASYCEPVVIMIDEFDEFLRRPGLDAALNQLKVLTKAVGDRAALPGIKSIVCAGSFALTTLIGTDAPQVKMVIGNQYSLSGDNIQGPSLQSPSGVPSPWNATSIVEASDFTMDQHIKLFNDIQTTYSMNFDKEVVDDVYSRTDGYPGLEGLLASLCIEFASTEHYLDFNTWDDRFTGFIRFPSTSKLSAVSNVRKYLDRQGEFEMKARNLLGRFLQMRTMQKSDIAEEDSLALTHLRALGIIKERDNLLDFTSNIIFDQLSTFYYPFHNTEIGIPTNLKFEKPADFLEKVLTLLQYIRHEVIFHDLAANQHSFSEAIIQGEFYSLLRSAIAYPTYKVFRETRTLNNSQKKCDIWVRNHQEYGIEVKVNKVSEEDIRSGVRQAANYTRGRTDLVCACLLNFLPDDSQPNMPVLPFPQPILRPGIYFETIHILYCKTSRTARVMRKGMQIKKIPFASH